MGMGAEANPKGRTFEDALLSFPSFSLFRVVSVCYVGLEQSDDRCCATM